MKEPPEMLFLQWHGDAEPDDLGDVSLDDVTWADEQVFEHDVAYLRVPDMTVPEARAALWAGEPMLDEIQEEMRDDVILACQRYPDAALVFVKAVIEARKEAPNV